MTYAAAMAVALCFSALAPAVAADQPPTPAPAMTSSPAAAPKGEFDDFSAMDLASGQVVKTDCSVNWTAPDGKIYCFSTEASKATFLKSPDKKHPVQEDGVWTQVPRYTFEGMDFDITN